MPLYRCSLTMQDITLLPRDQYENTVYLHTDDLPTQVHPTDAQWLAVELAMQSLYTGVMATFISPQIVGDNHWFRAYNMADAKPRVAVYEHQWSNAAEGSGTNALPSEVACCLSFQGTPQPLPIRPQSTRGRIFIGPLSTNAVQTGVGSPADAAKHSRPHGTMIGFLGDAGQRIAGAMKAIEGGSLVVYSPLKKHITDVVSCSCDDSWDLMHSRGDRPTSRTQKPTDNNAISWQDVTALVHA